MKTEPVTEQKVSSVANQNGKAKQGTDSEVAAREAFMALFEQMVGDVDAKKLVGEMTSSADIGATKLAAPIKEEVIEEKSAAEDCEDCPVKEEATQSEGDGQQTEEQSADSTLTAEATLPIVDEILEVVEDATVSGPIQAEVAEEIIVAPVTVEAVVEKVTTPEQSVIAPVVVNTTEVKAVEVEVKVAAEAKTSNKEFPVAPQIQVTGEEKAAVNKERGQVTFEQLTQSAPATIEETALAAEAGKNYELSKNPEFVRTRVVFEDKAQGPAILPPEPQNAEAGNDVSNLAQLLGLSQRGLLDPSQIPTTNAEPGAHGQAPQVISQLLADGGNRGGNGAELGNRGNQHSAFGLDTAQNAHTRNAERKDGATKLSANQQQEIIDRIKEMMQGAAQKHYNTTIVLHLNPKELGALTVKVTQRDEQVHARIIPESQDVENALRARANELASVLASTGLKLENVTVSIGREVAESEAFQFSNLLGEQNADFAKDGQSSKSEESRRPGFLSRDISATVTGDSGLIASPPEISGWVA